MKQTLPCAAHVFDTGVDFAGVAPAVDKDTDVPGPQLQPEKKWTIIYVEDSADDAAFAKRIMLQSPCIAEVVLIPDGPSLFRFLEHMKDPRGIVSNDHLMVVLDILLPGPDGLFLLQTLKDNPLTGRLPVVIMSGVDDIEMIYESFSSHADGYIQKPFTAAHLNDLHAVIATGSCWHSSGGSEGHA